MHEARGPGWIVNRAPTSRWQGVDLAEAWRYRELAFMLALRTFKLRYRQTFFGVAWAVLQPLVALAIFAVIFGRFARLPADGIPYAVFVFPALCLWTYVSTAVNAAAMELVAHQELVTKVYFPRVLAPVSALLPGIVDLMICLSLTAILMALTGVAPGPAIILLPVWIFMSCLVALGAGLWLSALNVRFRDIRQTLPFLLQTWFFVCPIVYPSSIIEDDWLRAAYSLNPMVGVIDGLRWSLLDAPAPPPTDAISVAVTLLLLISGLVYFKASERQFADVI
ncbi:MAG TPA: ABC transporter permease [Solirubrobacteraceae bacterium]|nr:ABC transporter permease [Solirubrobacteraceae bacterium]